MTELQMGLIGLGVTAVVAVLGYNKWQELRQRKLAERLLKVGHTDVLLDDLVPGNGEPAPGGDATADAEAGGGFAGGVAVGHAGRRVDVSPPEFAPLRKLPGSPDERIEPVFGVDPPAQESPTHAPLAPAELVSARRAPAPEALATALPATPLTAAAVRPPEEAREIDEPLHLLSPQVDYVVAFDAVEPAPAAHILDAQRAALARVRKAVHWIGYNELAREWETIVDDGQSEYRHFRVGLQLVDRRGPLSDSDLSVFHVAMQDLADQLTALAELPARRSVLESAVQLDGFCASVDIQIGINVISQGQAFPGTKLRALAEAAGMVIDAEGRFIRCDDDGNVLFVLLNQEAPGFSVDSMKTMATHGITFLLDVPRVAHGERVFNQMVDLARRFADVLRGALVDDNRRALSEGALDPIRHQVGQYQAIMAAQGLPAGEPLTQRLFS